MDHAGTVMVTVLLVGLVWPKTVLGSGSVKMKYFCAKSLTGSVNTRFSVMSLTECVMRCAVLERKRGLVFTEGDADNCLLIQSSCSGTETLMPQDGTQIYKTLLSHEVEDPTNPVVYFHFEEDQGWTNHGAQFVMEETPFAISSTVVKTDRSLSQWLDLGNQSQACVTIPESCGTQGGTVSAWVKRETNPAQGAIISSMPQRQTSFSIFSKNSKLYYAVDQTGGFYQMSVSAPHAWVHAVMVYKGLNQGITVYQDGSLIGSQTQRGGTGHTGGNGQLIIGNRNYGSGDHYVSASVDEIKLYNRQLSKEEICNMY